MRGRTEVVREDRVLAVLAGACVANVAAVQPARELQAPVPAARRLEQVPGERAHVPELRRRREPARLAEHVGDLCSGLELGERRPGADHEGTVPGLSPHASRNGFADQHEPLGSDDSVAHERHELRPARERPCTGGTERVDRFLERARPNQLQRAPVRVPRAAPAGSLPA